MNNRSKHIDIRVSTSLRFDKRHNDPDEKRKNGQTKEQRHPAHAKSRREQKTAENISESLFMGEKAQRNSRFVRMAADVLLLLPLTPALTLLLARKRRKGRVVRVVLVRFESVTGSEEKLADDPTDDVRPSVRALHR